MRTLATLVFNKHLLQILSETVSGENKQPHRNVRFLLVEVKFTFATMFLQWTMSLTPSNRRLPNLTDTALAVASHLTTAQLLLTLSQASFCVGNSLRHHRVHEWLEQETDNMQQAAELP